MSLYHWKEEQHKAGGSSRVYTMTLILEPSSDLFCIQDNIRLEVMGELAISLPKSLRKSRVSRFDCGTMPIEVSMDVPCESTQSPPFGKSTSVATSFGVPAYGSDAPPRSTTIT